jgi:hypothetical protein
MSPSLDEANDALRSAVRERLDHTPADDPKMVGYKREGCCDGGKCRPRPLSDAEFVDRFAGDFSELAGGRSLSGDGVMRASDVHPVSQKYFDLLDTLRDLHVSKSAGYGCPDGTDPLLNIRRGAEFVGIPAWQGAMVRLSDKVTRLAVFNKTGNLPHESVEDNLLDLASYSLLALLLYREERDG